MRNKRGEGYITACVTVVILCMLIAAFLTFISVVGTIRMTKRNARIVLDSFVIQNAIEIYDSVKNGTNHTQVLEGTEYVADLCDFCMFEERGEILYASSDYGEWMYSITKPVLSFTEEDTLKIIAEYTAIVPIRFGGVSVETVRIPVKVKSRFNEKF